MSLANVGPQVPRRRSGFFSWLAARLLRLAGWRVIGPIPDVPQAVVIAAPHTTNWDFVLAILVIWAQRLRISWMGKHTMFRWPFRALLRHLGGIPIDRRGSSGIVDATAEAFARNSSLFIGLAPEGTRARTDRWRSGFYYMALTAKVPILPVRINYGRREVVFGSPLYPSGDRDADYAVLGRFFALGQGKFPHEAGPLEAGE